MSYLEPYLSSIPVHVHIARPYSDLPSSVLGEVPIIQCPVEYDHRQKRHTTYRSNPGSSVSLTTRGRMIGEVTVRGVAVGYSPYVQ